MFPLADSLAFRMRSRLFFGPEVARLDRKKSVCSSNLDESILRTDSYATKLGVEVANKMWPTTATRAILSEIRAMNREHLSGNFVEYDGLNEEKLLRGTWPRLRLLLPLPRRLHRRAALATAVVALPCG